MIALPHLIGTQAILVETASEEEAVRLVDRISDLNRDTLLPVIERVLDEFDDPGRVFTVGRLDLDLGTIPPSQLALAAERLEDALRAALRRVLGDAAWSTAETPAGADM